MNILPHWLSFEKDLPSVCVYKKINVSCPDEATVDICGLGYCELYVNGEKVSKDLLSPAWTDYWERDFSTLLYPSNDKTGHRILYNRYDLKEYLKEGENTLCCILGNGFLRQTERFAEGDNRYSDSLYLAFDIKLTELGKEWHEYSDSSCSYCGNFITFNNVYYGERHDYSLCDDLMLFDIPENAKPCTEAPRPTSPLFLQECPADRVIKTLKPQYLGTKDGKKVYKVEENVTGHAVLISSGNNVKVTYAEEINDDLSLNYKSAGGSKQIGFDEYLNPRPEQYLYPHFTWHGFAYFDVEGECEVHEVEVVHTDMKQCLTFNSSNEYLNWIFNAYVRTQLNNCHGGVPSDCPHRERLGYTGDGQLTAELAMLTLDSRKFYEKWIRDILDCQDISSGHVQHTAPFYGGGGGPGGWGGAIVIVPYLYFKRYNETALIREAMPYMVKWIDSMISFSEKGLIVREYEGGWCLGDWCTLEDVAIPEPLVNTYYFIKALGYLAEMCKALGEDAVRFEALKTVSEKAFKQEFFNGETGTFSNSIQGADAFGYDLGLGDGRTLNAILEKYNTLGHFDTGIFGTDVLCKVLYNTKNFDLLYKLLTSNEMGSFGYMKEHGATTIWEKWNGHESHDHPMFGAAARFIIYGFAGLNHGGEKFIFEPNPVADLNFAEAEENSDRGHAKISWHVRDGVLTVEAECDRNALLTYKGDTTEFTGKIIKKYNV